MSAIVLLVITFISSLGDTLFLVGLPLYFYESNNESFLSSTVVSLVIYLTVFFARRFIIKIHKNLHTLDTVWVGEISMGIVELLFLFIYIKTNQPIYLVISIIPLAFIYNAYAVPKFFELQDYFYRGDIIKFTSILSLIREFGAIVGIVLAGLLIQNFSINEVIILDSLTFIFFGFVVYIYKKFLNDKKISKKATNCKKSLKSKSISISFKRFITYSCLAGFYTSWLQSSSIPTLSNSFDVNLDIISYYRAIFGIMGLGLGVLLINIFNKSAIKLWQISLVLIFIFPLVSNVFNIYVISSVLFLIFGVLKSSFDASKKEVYDYYNANKLYANLSSIQWTTESFFKIMLLPIAFIVDKFYKNEFSTFIVYILLLSFVGILSGLLNYEFIKKNYFK